MYTSNHNRYSYCLNNPLRYTDPSGYYFSRVENLAPRMDVPIFHDPMLDPRMGGGGGGSFYPNTGVYGLYYDWSTGSYRSRSTGNTVSWEAVQGVIAPYTSSSSSDVLRTMGVDAVWWRTTMNADGSHSEDAAGAYLVLQLVGDMDSYIVLPWSENAEGQGDGFNWGILIVAAGTAISAGTEYADNLVRTSFKTGRNPVSWSKLTPKQQAWRTVNVLDKHAKYVKYAKGAGVIGTGISVGMAGRDIYMGDGTTIDYFDVGIGTASIGAAIFLASNPVGWVISTGAAVYFAGRLVYDIYEEVKD